MFGQSKRVLRIFGQYVLMLVAHIIYAFAYYDLRSAVTVLICATVCFLIALLVQWVADSKYALSVIFFSVLLATCIIGSVLRTMSYAFVIFLTTGLLVTTFEDYKRILVFMVVSDIALVANAIVYWPAYGSDITVALFAIIFLCYNFAYVTICRLVYSLQKRIEELEIKTKEAMRASESKGNFLANMSHEIRTPMNAIQGLNQLIIQEDISDEVREKAFGIQTACSNLLTIINDVLDFSKIESGKMEVIDEEYDVKEMVQDIVNLFYLRTEEHSIEFLVDCDIELPRLLFGDIVRIKQVIMNLLSNAIKFTEVGYVKLSVSWEGNGQEGILRAIVEDTGIGIKQNVMNRLFDSFEQVDTKRNRKVEGTGLGLAISKRLATLMGGNIEVESEYGKGSVFTLTIPQQVVSAEPFVQFSVADKKILVYTYSDVFRDNSERMFRQAKLPLVYTTSFVETKQQVMEDTATHYFVADSCYYQNKEFFDELSRRREVIIMQNRTSNIHVQSDIRTMYRPIYLIPLEAIMNGAQSYEIFSKESVWGFDYVAPKANVLVVDDNDVNLQVTVGLMRPLNMKITTANSGAEAIKLVQQDAFDIIFMDHMMPEMDGVEAAGKIRALSEKRWDYYDTVPIIALTANAIGGAKEMFLSNGFQDFLAKPMELRDCDRVLRKWLPAVKIEEKAVLPKPAAWQVKPRGAKRDTAEDGRTIKVMWPSAIEGIDLNVAKHFFRGDAELFAEILSGFYTSGRRKQKELGEAFESRDWATYALETHALKSASKSIGAVVLAEEALELELAAKSEDTQTIHRKHKTLMKCLDALLTNVEPHVMKAEDEDAKPLMRLKELRRYAAELMKLIDKVESAMQEELHKETAEAWNSLREHILQMKQYRYSREHLKETVSALQTAAEAEDIGKARTLCQSLQEV